jgi:hypothetical protein
VVIVVPLEIVSKSSLNSAVCAVNGEAKPTSAADAINVESNVLIFMLGMV